MKNWQKAIGKAILKNPNARKILLTDKLYQTIVSDTGRQLTHIQGKKIEIKNTSIKCE